MISDTLFFKVADRLKKKKKMAAETIRLEGPWAIRIILSVLLSGRQGPKGKPIPGPPHSPKALHTHLRPSTLT